MFEFHSYAACIMTVELLAVTILTRMTKTVVSAGLNLPTAKYYTNRCSTNKEKIKKNPWQTEIVCHNSPPKFLA